MGTLEKKMAMRKAMKLLEDRIKFCFQTILTKLAHTDRLFLSYNAFG